MMKPHPLNGYWFLYVENLKEIEKPSPDFFAELDHLLKGLMGKSGIYPDKAPVFAKHEGKKAAKLRSADLSRMARGAQQLIDRYPCGLDNNAIRRRSTNKSRILKYFDATGQEWNDWKWQTRHIVRKAETLKALVKLTDEEYEAVALARENRIPFGITPYYLSLMDYQADRKRDYAVRAQVIPPLNYVKKLKEMRANHELSMDFMLERDTSPIEGITRRYPMIVILKPILTCPQICVYCQRNWEIEDVYSPSAALSREKLDVAIQWIADTPEIREVLITGGDPLLLSNSKIEYMLRKLSRIEHRVPIPRLLQEQQEEARLLPGSARTDEIVFNVPGLGKNYLRAVQHRDVISLLPDGRRVYEFHPWEKKLQLANTYVYTDVSIYKYLKRLKAVGEDTSLYRTIWYYY